MATPLRTALRPLSQRRAFHISSVRRAQKPFGSGPAPPRLPKEDQELFEKLQKNSTGAFSTPKEDVDVDVDVGVKGDVRPGVGMRINQSPDASSSTSIPPTSATTSTTSTTSSSQLPGSGRMQINQSPDSSSIKKGEEFHPNMRRGAPPEFEGDVNPKTGEVGGPKNEPLRWGSTGEKGDWSYNGRVTDF